MTPPSAITIEMLVGALARRCGLEDPDDFAAKGGAFATIPRDLPPAEAVAIVAERRGTGRSTRMLLHALLALSAGCEVQIVAADPRSAKVFHRTIAALATRGGVVDQGTLRYGLSIALGGQPSGRRVDVRLVDHACTGVVP